MNINFKKKKNLCKVTKIISYKTKPHKHTNQAQYCDINRNREEGGVEEGRERGGG